MMSSKLPLRRQLCHIHTLDNVSLILLPALDWSQLMIFHWKMRHLENLFLILLSDLLMLLIDFMSTECKMQ